MDDFERRVNAEIGRLEGPDFPTGRLARRQREATIRALAEATLAGRSWTGANGALGTNRGQMVVSENNFYAKKHWYAHPLTREVIENVTALFLEREAAEQEKARQEKRAWLEAKEIAAADKQFEKAQVLLNLPHVIQKSKQAVSGEEQTIILNPANAVVFNAAANLNMKASDLARRSLGLPVEVRRAELSGPGGEAINMKRDGLDEASDEQLQLNVTTLALGALATLGKRIPGSAVAGDEAGSAGDDPAGEG